MSENFIRMTRKKTFSKKIITIVIPCFNEVDNFKFINTKISAFAVSEKNYRVEVIIVDDGSSDNSILNVNHLKSSKYKIKYIQLSRNFGHQLAIFAGLEHANGDAVIIADADMQDPTSAMSEMIRCWEKGAEIVHGVRIKRMGESVFKKLSAKLFYKILNSLSKIDLPENVGDFKLIDKKVLKHFLELRENNPYLRGLAAWVGFKQEKIYYKRNARQYGVTKYPLNKMLKLGNDALFSFSEAPLKLSGFLAFIFGICFLAVMVWNLYFRFFTDSWVPGNSAIVLVVFFSTAANLISVAIIGKYVSRIYVEVQNRPRFIVSKIIQGHE